jgi:serine protease inhibitor
MVLRKILIALLGLSMLAAAVGCGGSSSISESQTEPGTAMGASLKTSPTGFDFEIFQRVTQEDSLKNVILSPLSARISLAMTYNGASGGTKKAMAEVLELEGLDVEEVNRQWRDLTASLCRADEAVQLEIVNSLWANQEFEFYDDFIDRCEEYYRAEVADLDYGDPQSVDVINGWVKEKTHDKIDEIVQSLNEELEVLLLLNALYFKGSWAVPFDPSLTHDGNFTLADGRIKRVPMMRNTGDYDFYEGYRFQAVRIPYGEGRMSMYVFLPGPELSLQQFIRELNPESWEGWMDLFEKEEIDIALPRFEVEYEKDLSPALRAMGMGPAFEGGFGEMGPNGEDWFIEYVKQKTYMDVNEEGTEAAAATATMMTTGIKPSIVVNRPFFLAIRDNQTGALLFTGSIVDP